MAAQFTTLQCSLPALAIAIIVLIVPVYGQINTACSPSMLSSFSSCMSFITNSTANGTSPTSDCCNSLKSITSNSTDCLCLIVTGSVPFQIPINRTLAIALPRACNMPGVPLQCKGSTYLTMPPIYLVKNVSTIYLYELFPALILQHLAHLFQLQDQVF